MMERPDNELDREIEQLMSVEPSADFVARVRTRVAQDSVRKGIHFKWALAWGAAFAAAVLAFALNVQAPQPEDRSARELPVIPPVVAAQVQAVDRPEPAMVNRPVRPATRPSKDRNAPDLEVLVNPKEAAALRSFLEGVQNGSIDVAKLAEIQRVIELQTPEDITPMPIAALEPIVIEPLVPGARQEGVNP